MSLAQSVYRPQAELLFLLQRATRAHAAKKITIRTQDQITSNSRQLQPNFHTFCPKGWTLTIVCGRTSAMATKKWGKTKFRDLPSNRLAMRCWIV